MISVSQLVLLLSWSVVHDATDIVRETIGSEILLGNLRMYYRTFSA